jgi:predicted metal-dependent phosphoesterase TrpH
MTWTLIQHVHTKHSFDSRAEPEAIVRQAVALGADVVAVTDHDTWRGAVETREAARRLGADVHVILGLERNTDLGDVIGWFLIDEGTPRGAAEFCDAVHTQGGLVVLPHPYKWHRLEEKLLERVDLIETYNARCSRRENERAETLAQELALPRVAGPDAHRPAEMGLARVVFEGERPRDEPGLKRALLESPRRFVVEAGSIWNDWHSQLVKFTRRPTPLLAWGLARGAARRVLKPGAYRG